MAKNSLNNGLVLAVSTLGVGYLPLAPGTFGSALAVLAYVGWVNLVSAFQMNEAASIFHSGYLVLFVAICLISFYVSKRTAEIKDGKDPQIVVIDEFAGQLMAFAFVPFTLSWPLILCGFLFFRLFDIWKPYPIKHFEEIPDGIGIVADDLVAGVYAGVLLSVVKVVLEI